MGMSELLNAIDGLGAQTGRLLFMTTNHPERLDEALIRDGRIDRRFHLGKANRRMAKRIFLSICTDEPLCNTKETQAEIRRDNSGRSQHGRDSGIPGEAP